MTTAAIIVAAGRGLRLGGPVPKQYQLLNGRPVVRRTIEAALASEAIDLVLVAISRDARDLYEQAASGLDDRRLLAPIFGGDERADTVRLALEALAARRPDAVLVHDAARPFAPRPLWRALAKAARDGTGAIAAEPVVDALWRADGDQAVSPVPREGLWRAQTPQAFPFVPLLVAHRAAAASDQPPALDDAEIFRRAGHGILMIPGDPDNFKLTTPADMRRAERLLAATNEGNGMDIRVGHGFDVHVFCDGDHVKLCGVEIPHERGLSGHSDADVGLHALADAIYGALAEGDIGQHFPPSDQQWKGAPSHIFLAHAAERVRVRGGRVANVDVTLLCEAPKIGPHASAMRQRVGDILGIEADRVGIKATTMERMGFVGREEGMGCIATATVIL